MLADKFQYYIVYWLFGGVSLAKDRNDRKQNTKRLFAGICAHAILMSFAMLRSFELELALVKLL